MPSSISDISIDQLKRAIAIRERMEALQQEHDGIMGGSSSGKRRGRPPKAASVASPDIKVDGRKGKRSAATRAKMKAAQQARWAAKKGAEATPAATQALKSPRKKRRTMSPEARAKIAAAQKARWAKVKG